MRLRTNAAMVAMVAASALLLGGCAIRRVDMDRRNAEFQATIPTCNSDQTCSAKWDAAQLWIVHHSGFKLQTVTNVLMETYRGGANSAELAFRVTKEPVGGGVFQILVFASCNNIVMCVPNGHEAAMAFNASVGAGNL